MTLLIDPPNAAGHGRLWSHLASDTSYDELHAFARTLGIPPRGFDRDHYDIPSERYAAVVAAGAHPVPSRELVARVTAAGLRRRKRDQLVPRRPGRPLVRAERLRPGDRVAVVATSGPAPADRLAAGVDVLASWGLDVVLAPHAQGVDARLSHLAAGDDERAADLVAAWTDPEVRAVFCARGGSGAQRVLELLDWAALAAAGPKLLVGFSDVTALHQGFASRLGLSTVHGPVVTSLGSGDEASREHLRRLLLEPGPGTSLTPERARTLAGGWAEGPLVGGTVALLAAELGTGTSHPAAGAIAVLEDVGEQPFRLDRLLTQLLRAGWFDGVRGIALGEFTDCGPAEAVEAVLSDRLLPLGVPVVAGLAVGHGRRNLAFPLGVPAALDADAGTLELRQSAVR